MGCINSQPEEKKDPVSIAKPEQKPRAKPPKVLHPSVHHTHIQNNIYNNGH